MRLGLYGGGFDPIHSGHIRPVWEARRALDLDRVLYLPTARPPHKEGREMAPAHARYAMVELALLWENGLYASAFELGEDAPSYTIDTIEHYRRTMPDAELVLLIGSDAFAHFATWRSWREILQQVEIGVMLRPGWEPDAIRESLPDALRRDALDEPIGKTVHFVENHPQPASSTEIRRQLAAGGSVTPGLMPALVLDYIRKYELYR